VRRNSGLFLKQKKHLTHGDAISTLRTYQSAIAYQSTILARKEPKCPHACDGLKSTLLWKAGVDQQLHFHMDMRDGGRASELDSANGCERDLSVLTLS